MGAPARQLDPMPGPLRAPRPARPRLLPGRAPARPARRPRVRPAARRNRGLALRRTVHAVGHLPETGVVRGLVRWPPLWICAISGLVIAIVFINVAAMFYGSSAGKLETGIQKLESRSAILRSAQTEVLSMPRIQREAAAAGMAMPAPDQIRYISYEPGDIDAAAARLAAEGG
ncbi:MAG: hypothetical protein M9938_04705 [Solirubrobacterales bacterium]|nr:hypothetical protein [Solirubrobacterales bacterium]